MRYTTKDISGAQPKDFKLPSTRMTNPLNPRYQIPIHYDDFPAPAKFIRDTLNVTDIPGTKAKIRDAEDSKRRPNIIKLEIPKTLARSRSHENLKLEPIEGSAPKKPHVCL